MRKRKYVENVPILCTIDVYAKLTTEDKKAIVVKVEHECREEITQEYFNKLVMAIFNEAKLYGYSVKEIECIEKTDTDIDSWYIPKVAENEKHSEIIGYIGLYPYLIFDNSAVICSTEMDFRKPIRQSTFNDCMDIFIDYYMKEHNLMAGSCRYVSRMVYHKYLEEFGDDIEVSINWDGENFKMNKN